MQHKEEFLQYFMKETKGIKKLVLKHLEDKLTANSFADIDLLVQKKDMNQLTQIIDQFPEIERLDRIKKHAMHQWFIFFTDGSFLQMDFLFKLVRKELEYLDADKLLNNLVWKNGVPTYDNFNLLEHVFLFNYLNHSGIPQKYINHFSQLPPNQQATLIHHLNDTYQLQLKRITDLAGFDASVHKKVVQQLRASPLNSLVNRARHTKEYLSDSIRDVFHVNGKIITFSGVDGAGKSTMIELTKETLANKYRKKVVVLRHRPSLLPILSAWRHGKKKAEERAANTLPHSGTSKGNGLGSYVRFGYYYLDYLVGQLYVFVKYLCRDYIVIYDRYYFDFIIDGKRSNLKVPSRLSKPLYRFIHKPALNFFLFADAEVIRKRKKELPVTTIRQLTSGYCSLFEELNGKYKGNGQYLAIENIEKQHTLNTIIQYCKQII